MSYSDTLCAHYLELAKCPVSELHFAGGDVRYSSEYEALENELAKSSSMHEGNQVDWREIREGSEQLLRAQSKDLRVSTWLTWALYQLESFQGLLAGLGLVRHLCEHHWDEIHPEKARTRLAALNWLVSRIEPLLTEQIAVKEQLSLFQLMAEHLEGLDAVCTARMGDEAPLLLPLCRRLKSRVQSAVDNPQEPVGVSAAVAQVKHATTQLLNSGAVIDSEKDAHKALRAQQQNARPLCEWWLKQKATDVRALRLNRTLLWLAIDTLPERNAEQVTALRSVPADRLKVYQDQYAQARYAELLLELEASLANAPFWFDGQRMVWECLQALNAEMAMREVEVHFALLIQRLPGVVELRFHDGTPFADAVTRAWVSGHVMKHMPTAAAPRKVEEADALPVWERALEEAMSVLRKDGLRAAVQLIKQGQTGAHGGRVRFLWQFALARLCFMAKKYELARVQLETLDQTLHTSGVGGWEPDLALEVLQLLHTCCGLLPQTPALHERKEQIYRRLCHLDLEVVLEQA